MCTFYKFYVCAVVGVKLSNSEASLDDVTSQSISRILISFSCLFLGDLYTTFTETFENYYNLEIFEIRRFQ